VKQAFSGIKTLAGQITSLANKQCDFARAIFVIGHMRCGSTAVSNILCSRPDVSGYGEAHISYDSPPALGVLTLNQIRRHAWRRDAAYLFDKILHSRYHDPVCDEFYEARAIFMVREPTETILSIRKLFETIGSAEYATDDLAADYYEERLNHMLRIWPLFDATRRVGFSYHQLTNDPEHLLARISAKLEIEPALENHYAKQKSVMGAGAGDPLASHKFDSIVPKRSSTSLEHTIGKLNITDQRMNMLNGQYHSIMNAFEEAK
jgi:Sulfotransferase family